jgi:hypothetical protein
LPAKPGKHVESPFVGLANKPQDYASRLDDASRRAFNNLIALGIEEECRLIVLAVMQMVVKLYDTKRVGLRVRRLARSRATSPNLEGARCLTSFQWLEGRHLRGRHDLSGLEAERFSVRIETYIRQVRVIGS